MSRILSHHSKASDLIITIGCTVLLTACGVSGSPRSELAENQAILKTCDPAKPPASLIELDGSKSSLSKEITAERMEAVEQIVRKTVICEGTLRVLVFSSSSASTVDLYEGAPRLDGATDNAKLKRVPKVVAEVMDEITGNFEDAVAELPGGGSDITAQYRLASEWVGQLDGDAVLNLYVFTDGFQNVGISPSKAVSKTEAAKLAGGVDVPKLPGASVTVAGLGRVAKNPPSSKVVEGLVSFYDALCAKTKAATCSSVTDYAVGR